MVLISIDTLRSDRLPVYGYDAGATPAIDALRRDAILVERAYTQVPLTLPAHVSLLSGLLPAEHGVHDNLGYPLDPAVPLLQKLLAEHGYETAGAVSAAVLRSSTGVASGFERWSEPGDAQDGATPRAERPAADTLHAIEPWLREAAGGPFFLFFHLYEPHAPYRPAAPFDQRFESAYDGEVAAADAAVGELLDLLRALEVYDRSLVILLSDHGEGLGDHGEREHGVFLYREALQVPLLIKLPRARLAGSTIAAPAQLIDVAPTVLEVAGVERPAGLRGTSLLELDDATAATPRRLFAETLYPRIHFGWSELRSVVESNLHFIDAPQPELYDLVADPGERATLLDRDPKSARALRAAIRELPQRVAEPVPESPQDRERLATLGYLAGGAAPAPGTDLPDPKSQLAVLGSLEEAIDLEARGDLGGTVRALRDLVAAAPENAAAWSRLGGALERLDRSERGDRGDRVHRPDRSDPLDEALAARRRAFELSGRAAPEALELATILLALGRPLQARDYAAVAAPSFPREAAAIADRATLYEGREAARSGKSELAVRILSPLAEKGDPEALTALATALSDAGRQDEALAVAERAVAAGSGSAPAFEALGLVRLRRGEPAAAIEPLRRAVELDPSLANAWNLLGVALRGAGDFDGAIAAWQRSLAVSPHRLEVVFNLGTVAADAGRTEIARENLEYFVRYAPVSSTSPEDLDFARRRLRSLGGAGQSPTQ